jgi:hypothetical protein
MRPWLTCSDLENTTFLLWAIRGLHSGKSLDCDLGCDTAQSCKWLPTVETPVASMFGMGVEVGFP